MDYIATQKYVLTSPKKLRAVAYLVRKLKPREAVEKLPFAGKRAAEPIMKVIMTALANAKVQNASEDALVFKEIQIMEGPMLKRFRAGARGRAKPYKRKMSHIRVVLTTKPEPTKKVSSDKKVETQKALKNTKNAQRKNKERRSETDKKSV